MLWPDSFWAPGQEVLSPGILCLLQSKVCGGEGNPACCAPAICTDTDSYSLMSLSPACALNYPLRSQGNGAGTARKAGIWLYN